MAKLARLFQCLARAAVKNGGKALCSLVPLGDVAYDIARDTYDNYCKEHPPTGLRKDLEHTAQASPAEIQQAAVLAAEREAVGQSAEIRQALVAYLAQVPGSIKQSLRRPTDPEGKTVPANLFLQRAEHLMPFLPASLPQFKPGDRPLAADWELVELLGKGGFGEVWKARHLTRSSAKPVALKFCLDPTAAHSLRNEATLHDLLDRLRQDKRHTGIVPLLETYLRADPPCLMYELIEGGDLASLARELHAQGQLTADFAGRATYRLALIVAAAHRLTPPIVHRDLKMSNILVRRTEGKLDFLVADFGIGGLAADQALRAQPGGRPEASRTLVTAVRGAYTPLYASPQQVAGDPPDPRDDVHALGVIWYQLVTGSLHLLAIPSDWRDFVGERGLSAELTEILGTCLSSRAEKRPKDARVLADQLESLVLHRPMKDLPSIDQLDHLLMQGRLPKSAATSVAPPAPPARKNNRSNSLGNDLVRVPHDFQPKGTPNDEVLFASRTCVCNADYRVFVTEGGRPPRIHPKFPHQRTWDDANNYPRSLDRHPVVYVTHEDATAFCRWLTQKEQASGVIGKNEEYRLPTVEQWKAFARGCAMSEKTVIEREWQPGRHQPTEPVDFEVSNYFRFCCLLGNVFEWCSDWDERDFVFPSKDGQGPERRKIKRFAAIGGGWVSTRAWLQQQVERGQYGAIMHPNGWPMRDGGFRLCLVERK